jgi:5-methyltetrahydrofolate--homocysteine methyltransferase
MYDTVESWLQEADMPSMSWTNIAAKRSHWMICNDFSIMISPAMFDEFFLPYVKEEAKKFKRSMYHLDGVGALHHLDSILRIKELGGVQFLPGAGAGPMRDYLHVFQKIQEAGKCLEILQPSVEDLDILIKGLRPEGVILNWITGVTDLEHARKIEQKILAWGQQYGYGLDE